jgi:N4-gp56 family major capsid protein
MATVTTATGSISPEIREFYDKNMLAKAEPELVHVKYARKKPIPKGMGAAINWRRGTLLTPASTPLTEGVTPAGNTLTIVNVRAVVSQYGDWVAFSDVVGITTIDPILTENSDILGQQAGATLDVVAREVYVAGTNVRYANGRVSRVTVAAGDIINDSEIKKITRQLRVANARSIGGRFVGIVHPNTVYDLQSTAAYTNAGAYQDKAALETGQVFDLYGVTWVETTNAKVFTGAGAAGIDVYATLVFGAESLGSSSIEGLDMETIYKPLGSSGTDDPLNQRQTQAWKASFVAVILNQTWNLRFEHAVSA